MPARRYATDYVDTTVPYDADQFYELLKYDEGFQEFLSSIPRVDTHPLSRMVEVLSKARRFLDEHEGRVVEVIIGSGNHSTTDGPRAIKVFEKDLHQRELLHIPIKKGGSLIIFPEDLHQNDRKHLPMLNYIVSKMVESVTVSKNR